MLDRTYHFFDWAPYEDSVKKRLQVKLNEYPEFHMRKFNEDISLMMQSFTAEDSSATKLKDCPKSMKNMKMIFNSLSPDTKKLFTNIENTLAPIVVVPNYPINNSSGGTLSGSSLQTNTSSSSISNTGSSLGSSMKPQSGFTSSLPMGSTPSTQTNSAPSAVYKRANWKTLDERMSDIIAIYSSSHVASAKEVSEANEKSQIIYEIEGLRSQDTTGISQGNMQDKTLAELRQILQRLEREEKANLFIDLSTDVVDFVGEKVKYIPISKKKAIQADGGATAINQILNNPQDTSSRALRRSIQNSDLPVSRTSLMFLRSGLSLLKTVKIVDRESLDKEEE